MPSAGEKTWLGKYLPCKRVAQSLITGGNEKRQVLWYMFVIPVPGKQSSRTHGKPKKKKKTQHLVLLISDLQTHQTHACVPTPKETHTHTHNPHFIPSAMLECHICPPWSSTVNLKHINSGKIQANPSLRLTHSESLYPRSAAYLELTWNLVERMLAMGNLPCHI